MGAFVRRLVGYKRDQPHKKTQRDARELRGGITAVMASGLASSFSYRSLEAIQVDQSDIGDCTWAGTTQALSLVDSMLTAAGLSPAVGFTISQQVGYAAIRQYERALATPVGTALPPLTDSGAEPADIMLILQRYGVAQMSGLSPAGNFSDVWDGNVNDEVDLRRLEQAAPKVVTGEYRIADGTPASDIQNVLVAGQAPLGIGGFVDSQVLNYTAGAPAVGPPDTRDPNGGGHWFTCTGWRQGASGVEWEFWNTWGRAYGDDGHFWGTDAFMQAMWDRYSWSVR